MISLHKLMFEIVLMYKSIKILKSEYFMWNISYSKYFDMKCKIILIILITFWWVWYFHMCNDEKIYTKKSYGSMHICEINYITKKNKEIV